MSDRQRQHAESVVERFKTLIPEQAKNDIGDDHFSELSMMIESAISTTVLLEMEKVAESLDKLSIRYKQQAEHYQN